MRRATSRTGSPAPGLAAMLCLLLALAAPPSPARALDGVFTYQGELRADGSGVTGACDFRFSLFDAVAGGGQIDSTRQVPAASVTGGAFTLELDFGQQAFDGGSRWLEIAVRCPAGSGSFTTLSPRQRLTAAPYALYSGASGSAPWGGLIGVPAGFGDGIDNDTTYGAGVGLALDGTTFSVAQSYRLPQSCASGQVPKWGGTAWSCAADNDTTFSGGAGISVGGGAIAVQFGGSGAADSAARSDHLHAVRTIVVHPTPGDAIASGTSLRNALAGVSDASSGNPYLLKLEPGTYDLGSTALVMRPYVDIEGSGVVGTKITAAGRSALDGGTLMAADNAEVRLLTVENSGGNAVAVAVYCEGASPRLTDVVAIAADGTEANYGVYSAGALAAPTLTRLIAFAFRGGASYAIYSTAASPIMADVSALAIDATSNYGVFNQAAFADMNDVTVRTAGGATGYGVYNASSSPLMHDVRIDVGTAGAAYGVYNADASSPTMTDVSITATAVAGGSASYGVFNSGASNPVLSDATIEASGAEQSNYGVYNASSSARMSRVTVAARDGAASYGVFNAAGTGSYVVTVDHSQITAATNTVRNDAGFATAIGASKLDGGAVTSAGGTVKCAGVYDENYAFQPGPACP